jgi:DNA-binding beta-propeller fold protein YncE
VELGVHAEQPAPSPIDGAGPLELVALPGSRADHVPVMAAPEVAAAIAAIGRTEDVALSPSGSTLALAAFNADALALVSFEQRLLDARPAIVVHSCTLVRVEGMHYPHGVAFLSDDTLVVANRHSELLLIDVDAGGDEMRVAGRVLVDGSHLVPVRWPGSAAVHPIGDDLAEIVVCNNYAHDVTRYLLDGRAGWSVIDAEVLLSAGLEIPDGVASTRSGDWIAISNHNHHCVNLYRVTDDLGPASAPDGTLQHVNYPHGLRFTDGGRTLFVADAGLPYVHRYDSPDGDWSGARKPTATRRVMSDETFGLGRYNPQEGGPKGLAVVDGLVVVTSEFQPLAFIDCDEPVGDTGSGGDIAAHVPAAADRSFGRVLRRATRRLTSTDEEHRTAVARFETTHAALAVAEQRSAELEADLAAAQLDLAGARVALAEVEARRCELDERLGAIERSRTWRWRARLLPVLGLLALVQRKSTPRRR